MATFLHTVHRSLHHIWIVLYSIPTSCLPRPNTLHMSLELTETILGIPIQDAHEAKPRTWQVTSHCGRAITWPPEVGSPRSTLHRLPCFSRHLLRVCPCVGSTTLDCPPAPSELKLNSLPHEAHMNPAAQDVDVKAATVHLPSILISYSPRDMQQAQCGYLQCDVTLRARCITLETQQQQIRNDISALADPMVLVASAVH